MVEEVSEKELEEAKKAAKELQARNVSLTKPKLVQICGANLV